jgi:hypothetical protein
MTSAKRATRLSPADAPCVAFRLDPPMDRCAWVVAVLDHDPNIPAVSFCRAMHDGGVWRGMPGPPLCVVPQPTVGQALVALGYNVAESAPGADEPPDPPPACPDLRATHELRLANLDRAVARHERALAALFDRAGMTLPPRKDAPPAADDAATFALSREDAGFVVKALRDRATSLEYEARRREEHRAASPAPLREAARRLDALADRVDAAFAREDDAR